MKRITILILTFILGLTPVGIYTFAQSPQPTANARVIIITGKEKSNRDVKPKGGFTQHIDCLYENGYLFIDFDTPEGDCLLTVTERGNPAPYPYFFSSVGRATVYIGNRTTAYLEIYTEDGNEYEGNL